jgi:hypothetical protein
MMINIATATDRVLHEVRESPGCLLEEVVLACPELSWSQVFYAVDALTRTGLLQMKQEGPGVYTLHTPWDA